jgi:hypothetical protein
MRNKNQSFCGVPFNDKKNMKNKYINIGMFEITPGGVLT